MPKKKDVIEPINAKFDDVVDSVLASSRPTLKPKGINDMEPKTPVLVPTIQEQLFHIEAGISARLRAQVLDRNGFTCQMCGLTPGDIDPTTNRKVRLHIGHIKDRSLKGETDIANLRTLCSTCNQGAKNITSEKPTAIWLLAQTRRAGIAEQRAVYDWLKKKLGD